MAGESEYVAYDEIVDDVLFMVGMFPEKFAQDPVFDLMEYRLPYAPVFLIRYRHEFLASMPISLSMSSGE